ncbi:sulfite exporter TauE/SafE family protein [Actinoplanes sp. NPDC051470]|uniref:urease accessory protein UreH domain-containing protein n=1 Tax=Actinoplanes sp. NPDC051470 TaxID=3157224 RepID=UPI0034476204
MKRAAILLALVIGAVLLLPAGPASAHPLGNFSVNTYAALTVHPDRLDAVVVADIAELPTLQDPAPTCASAASTFTVTVSGRPVAWTVASSSFASAPGAGGLSTSRLSCTLSAPAALGDVAMAFTFRDDRIGWRELVATAGPGVALEGSPLPTAGISDELRHYPSDLLTSPPSARTASFTSRAGAGSSSALSEASPLSAGPLEASPLSSRPLEASPHSAGPLARAERYLEELVGGRRLTPWVGALAVVLALLLGAGHAALPGHGKTVMAAYLAGRRGRPRDAVAVGATVTLTHTGGVLALGLLLTTAAGVAGETILGYLGLVSGVVVTAIGAGALIAALRRRGGPLDAHHHHGPGTHSHDEDGGHTHTRAGAQPHLHAGSHQHDHAGPHTHAGADSRAPGRETTQPHVHASGRTLAGAPTDRGGGVTTGPRATAVLDLPRADGEPADVTNDQPHHDHAPGQHERWHSEGDAHTHKPDRHAHAHTQKPGHHHSDVAEQHRDNASGPSRWSIAGMGIAGGLVPSPSALIVLLGAAALGRTVFGVLLVIAYGAGMAATLTAAGLLLIKIRDRLEGRLTRLRRLRTAAPILTAALILIVGAGLAGRAVIGLL